jgi:hypothetical protein
MVAQASVVVTTVSLFIKVKTIMIVTLLIYKIHAYNLLARKMGIAY